MAEGKVEVKDWGGESRTWRHPPDGFKSLWEVTAHRYGDDAPYLSVDIKSRLETRDQVELLRSALQEAGGWLDEKRAS